MTENSQPDGDLFDQIHELADAAVSGRATDEHWQRLDRLVESNDEALALYVDYMYESLAIRRVVRANRLATSFSHSTDDRDWIEALLPEAIQNGAIQNGAMHNGAMHNGSSHAVARANGESSGIAGGRRKRKRKFAVAACVLAGIALAALCIGILEVGIDPPELVAPAPLAVGRLTRSANVRWTSGASRWSVDDPLAVGSAIAFDSGRVELQFDSGAMMTVVGPAELKIQSANLVALHAGTATTRIENGNSGEFRVVTPATEVLDLGTEFGVRVRGDGETDVVVFEGKVDVTPIIAVREGSRVAQRLLVGEAVCVSEIGGWKRLVSIESDAFPTGDRIFPRTRRRPPIITRVTDDRRHPNIPKFYQIYHEGLDEDVRAYVDRKYEWNGVTEDGMPHFLRGADYVATFNDDKRNSPEITVELSGPAVLYVLLDDRMPVPDWLSESFENTGHKIGLDEGPSALQQREVAVGPGKSIDWIFSVWCRRVDRPDRVVLRPLTPVKGGGGTMLGIAAQPF